MWTSPSSGFPSVFSKRSKTGKQMENQRKTCGRMWKTFFYFSFPTDKTEKTKTKNEKQNAKWKTKRWKNPKERNKIKDFQDGF